MMWVRVLLIAGVFCGASHAIHVESSGPALTLMSVMHSKGTATASAGQRLQAKSVAVPVSKQDALRLKGGGEQKLLPLIIALFKAIVGSGILSLAYSVASWTDNPAMIAPVCVLTLLFAIMSGHCYALIGEVTLATGASSYQDAWAKSIDAKTAWIPGFTLLIKTLLTTIMYSIILGDLGYDLMKGLGVKGWFAQRNNLLAFVSATVLLPLCLLRDFAMLSYTSILGVLGVLYTAAFMVFRFFQGAYSPGGEFWLVTHANSKPVFGKRFQGIKTLILMATLNSAYMTHYNAPRFFDLMKPRTLEHFRKLVFPAFLAAGFINVLVMAAGFLTFGGTSNGLILNSYASTDKLAVWSRLGVGFSVLFGYPFVLDGFRSGLLAATHNTKASQLTKDLIAIGTILLSTCVATVMRDLGFLAAFSGAVFGSCLIYIYPTMMHMSIMRKQLKGGKADSHGHSHHESKVGVELAQNRAYQTSRAINSLGWMLAFLGGCVSYLKTFTNLLK